MNAKSIKGNSTTEIKTALAQSFADGFKPTLAFVFISINQDWEAVSNLLDQEGIKIFGATTAGEFIDGDIGAGTIAILLVDMDPANFMVLLEDYSETSPEVLTQTMARKAKEKFSNPSFFLSISIEVVHGTGLGEPILRAIESVTGPETIIWGGRAGDDFAFNKTIVFSNQVSMDKGILLLVLDGDKISVKGQSASGQTPVGTEKTVTRMEGEWLYELDHQPAAEMAMKYLGLNPTEAEAETFNPNEDLQFSLSRSKGDPVLRAVGRMDWKTKGLSILGSMKEGDKVRFTLPPDFEIIDDVIKNAEQFKREKMSDPDALLMFSCIGRLGQFGPLVSDEIDGVRNVFKVPMAGFFTYGEFGRTKHGNNEFHNNTCCWVALSEK